mmetsp:Transcript_26972/g.62735  ORF Transcript_26972/g.62735 Transcript_26972/m.62735 type:complete len:473 (+) Transcript_26972:46-1464(+)
MDIIGDAEQFIILVLLIIGLYVLFLFRHQVTTVLTGDDRIHVDPNSIFWQIITCCRNCECEWTRLLTRSNCWPFPSCKDKNLLHVLGQRLGFVQIPIQIVNVVVGDLPANRAGDYYLTIETSSNPPQITAVAENADPKVISFPDSMLIKVRNSPVESNVRFCLKRMHAVGSVEICDCYINPKMLLYWQENESGPVRVRMEPCRKDYTFALPAWILMQVMEHPGAHRGLDTFDVSVKDFKTGRTVVHETPHEFKRNYQLLDATGFQSREPDEAGVGSIDAAHRHKALCLGQLLVILIFGSGAFLTSRLYCLSCFQQYTEIAVLNNFGVLFPVFAHDRLFYEERCNLNSNILVGLVEEDVLAGKAKLSNERVDPDCAITRKEVEKICMQLPIGANPPSVEIPLFIMNVPLPCFKQTCFLDSYLREWGFSHFVFVLVMLTLMILTWAGCNWRIRTLQNEVIKESRGITYTAMAPS